MSATGLDVFDKTLQTTNIWLDELMADIGPDRKVAWHVLGAALRALRDRLPRELAAHLGAQLPLLVRGAYYDGYTPAAEPLRLRDQDALLDFVRQDLGDIRPVNVRDAVVAVFALLSACLARTMRQGARCAAAGPRDAVAARQCQPGVDRGARGHRPGGAERPGISRPSGARDRQARAALTEARWPG